MSRRVVTGGFIATMNAATRGEFRSLGIPGGRYTMAQKTMALELVDQHGVRGVGRILHVNRRTLQRWCREAGKSVPDCPVWLYDWVERRNSRTG